MVKEKIMAHSDIKGDYTMNDSFYENNYKFLYNYAVSHTGDEQLALDAVQDTFLWALIKEDEVKYSKSPTGWLFKTLRNVIGNEYQKKNKHRFVELGENLVSTYEVSCGIYELLPKSMPETDKTILIMRFEKCYSYDDISTNLGINATTCRKRLSRAVRKCRECEYVK